MSPILVRPVREQLEHDRIIRLLQTKCRKKYEAGINPGSEQTSAVGTGPSALYPDVVLLSLDRSRRLEVVIEVETGESVNHLEALAQWLPFSRLKAAFHLYVPSGMIDVARRLCEDNQIEVGEIWSYHAIGEDVRFTMVHKGAQKPEQPEEPAPAPRRAPAVTAAAAAPAPAAASHRKPAVEAAKRAPRSLKAASPRKPVKKAARGQARAAAQANSPSRTQKRK